jgi:hypothetical protein
LNGVVGDTYPRVVEDAEVLLARGDERLSGRLRCWLDGFDGPTPSYRIELRVAADRFTATAQDVFEALVRLRHQLEPDGWLIAVQGARRDTYPSGMLRDMGGGTGVYVLRKGKEALQDDVVTTLAEAEVELVGTVAEQQANWTAWFGDVRSRRLRRD